MLGVPPAFVLSQDQTLHRVVSPSDFTHFEIWFIANRSQLLLRFIVLSDFSYWFQRINKGSSFSCLFFPRIVQFSRCSLCRFLEVLASSSDLFIIPHFRKFVKPFFKLFQVFSGLFLAKAFRLYLSLLCVSRPASDSFSDWNRSCNSRPQTIHFSRFCALFRLSSFALSSDSFIIIPRLFPFVNCFFQEKNSL